MTTNEEFTAHKEIEAKKLKEGSPRLISGWQTSDGKIFATEQEANNWTTILKRKAFVEEWVEQYCYSGMDKSYLVRLITENWDSLNNAIWGYPLKATLSSPKEED